MTRERFLKLFLRLVGTVAGTAVFCAVMPYAWMDAAHQMLGLGALCEKPIVGYLARSTSFFYALLGGLFWVVSLDLPRYLPLVRKLGFAIVLMGVFLCGVAITEHLPRFWQVGEGTADVFLGCVLLWASRPGKPSPTP